VKLFNFFNKKKEIDSTQDDLFVALVQLALNDGQTGQMIRNLVMVSRNEREAYLEKIISDLKKNDVDIKLINALNYLHNEQIISKIKEII
jgi:hypothetical protein